jgi:hypothetical protein
MIVICATGTLFFLCFQIGSVAYVIHSLCFCSFASQASRVPDKGLGSSKRRARARSRTRNCFWRAEPSM